MLRMAAGFLRRIKIDLIWHMHIWKSLNMLLTETVYSLRLYGNLGSSKRPLPQKTCSDIPNKYHRMLRMAAGFLRRIKIDLIWHMHSSTMYTKQMSFCFRAQTKTETALEICTSTLWSLFFAGWWCVHF